MRSLLGFVLLYAIFSAAFAVEMPDELKGKAIPDNYKITGYIYADLNGDGLGDIFLVLEKNEKVGMGIKVNRKHRLGIIFIGHKDEKFAELERNDITVSCENCDFGYSIENFTNPTKITSWIPYHNYRDKFAVYIPDEIVGFAENDHRIKAWASADLNGDGLSDYIVVEEKQKLNEKDPDIKIKQRPVLILIRQQDQSLKLEKRNDIAVSCETCGHGYSMEGFETITAGKRTFSIINRDGGTAYNNTHTYTFGFSRRDNTWQLTRVYGEFEPNFLKDKPYKVIETPPKDFGKIDFSDFDPESYLGKGE